VPNEQGRKRTALCLWAGAALLAASGTCLWAGGRSPGELGRWYLGNLLLHLACGLALLPVFTAWLWRRRRSATQWGRGSGLGGGLLLGSGGAGLPLLVLGNRKALQPLLWSHVALAAAGLAVLMAVVAARRWGSLRRFPSAGVSFALLLPLLFHVREAGRPPGRAQALNAGNPQTMADEAMGGKAGPFYPSALHTSGGLLPAAAVAESQSCGRSGCHPDELAEWSASPHRFSGLDNPWYRRSYEEMRGTFGAVPARWCGGCHTPALLASGGMDRPAADVAGTPAAVAGVSCTVCHVARVRSSRGQADLDLDLPPLHDMAASPRGFTRALYGLLVRIDPEPHRRAYSRATASSTSSELCSACHNAMMDQPVNGYRPQNVMNDYGTWQTGSSSGQSLSESLYFPPPQSCVDCHMAREAGSPRGRSHRFAAANTALPVLHGDRAQLAAVIDFLRAGRATLDIFAMTGGRPVSAATAPAQGGPAEEVYAPLNRLPATLRRGESTRFDIVVRNVGVGHRFPGGKDVLKDCWLEVKAVDERGKTIFWSGKADEGKAVEPGAHFFSGAWVDQNGRPMSGYETWNDHIEIYSKRIAANTTALASVRVNVPADAGARLTLTARLRYRKLTPAFTSWVFTGPGAAGLGLPPAPVVPIVTLAETSLVLPVVDTGAPLPDMTHPASEPTVDSLRWYDYAYALGNQGGGDRSRRAFRTVLALQPDYAEGWTTLGNLEWALGDFAGARTDLEQALRLDPSLARARYYLGLVERDEGHIDRALPPLRTVADRYPRDRAVLKDLGKALMRSAEYREAVAVLERARAVDPTDPTVHFMLTLGYRALGDVEASKDHEISFNRFKTSGGSNAGVVFVNAHPEVRSERRGLHEHESMPLDGVDHHDH
jgi:Flp pilus assembly protein TadD